MLFLLSFGANHSGCFFQKEGYHLIINWVETEHEE